MSVVTEEKYEFTGKAKRNILGTLAAGVILLVLGIATFSSGGHDSHGDAHETKHEAVQSHGSDHGSSHDEHATHAEDAHAESDHGGETTWLKRLKVNLWISNIYFVGLALIGAFFIAIQYASQAGWSAGVKRIPMAMGSWLPIAGILTIVLFFFVKSDVFHWTHVHLYHEGGPEFDSIINGKKGYFFFPLSDHPGAFPTFYMIRMVVFFAGWVLLFRKIKSLMLTEDLEGGTQPWYKARKASAIFLLFFAVSSSIAAWDWVMSIDTHWFSTMFGWYVFASWWVSGLALITLIVSILKDKGYLAVVNANHLHDLGKFVFAFSIFWTYIWFSQFLLIYYANIPEETVYFWERWRGSDTYTPLFFLNLFVNFVFPFLFLMARDAKRYTSLLKIVCVVVLAGHWLDFYLMMTPGTLGKDGSIGLIEVGTVLIFLGAFLYVTFRSLTKHPLVAKNHPMLGESLHHHI